MQIKIKTKHTSYISIIFACTVLLFCLVYLFARLSVCKSSVNPAVSIFIPVKVYPHKAPILPAWSGLRVGLLIEMLICSVLHKTTWQPLLSLLSRCTDISVTDLGLNLQASSINTNNSCCLQLKLLLQLINESISCQVKLNCWQLIVLNCPLSVFACFS